MPHQIIHPAKEQVRAYMAGRGAARRPPPAPEEIRRQLGWRLAPPEAEAVQLSAQAHIQFYLIPTIYGQLAAQIMIDLVFASARPAARQKNRQ